MEIEFQILAITNADIRLCLIWRVPTLAGQDANSGRESPTQAGFGE